MMGFLLAYNMQAFEDKNAIIIIVYQFGLSYNWKIVGLLCNNQVVAMDFERYIRRSYTMFIRNVRNKYLIILSS